MLKPKKGRLLISEPSMEDSNFFRSVILLAVHNKNESVGFVLNQPTKIKVHHLIENFPKSSFPIYIGGPVEKQSLHFIHTLGSIIPNSKQIIDGIYFGGDFDTVIQLMHDKKITKNEIRFFVGYSGWEAEQLNNEIRDDAWIVQTAKNELCMNYSTPKLWSDIIKTKKMEHAIWANMPKDPSLN